MAIGLLTGIGRSGTTAAEIGRTTIGRRLAIGLRGMTGAAGTVRTGIARAMEGLRGRIAGIVRVMAAIGRGRIGLRMGVVDARASAIGLLGRTGRRMAAIGLRVVGIGRGLAGIGREAGIVRFGLVRRATDREIDRFGHGSRSPVAFAGTSDRLW
jgi:hypothetical protein